MDWECLIRIGILFQMVGAATRKAREPITLDTEGWCSRSRLLDRRSLTGLCLCKVEAKNRMEFGSEEVCK